MVHSAPPLFLCKESITLTVDCQDVLRIGRIVFEFLPQPRNVHVNGSSHRRFGVSPDFLQEFIASDNLAIRFDQMLKEPALALR